MDLSKVVLPAGIVAGGKFFSIKTDFRYWLDFARVIADKSAVVDDADFIYSDVVPDAKDKTEAFTKLLDFYSPKKELPRDTGNGGGEKVLDYAVDADLIYSAFYEQYGIDLMATDKKGHAAEMHWHKFLALLAGLHDTKLNEIMGYRCYDADDKADYKKQMARLKEMWRLPQENDARAQEDLESFNRLFG